MHEELNRKFVGIALVLDGAKNVRCGRGRRTNQQYVQYQLSSLHGKTDSTFQSCMDISFSVKIPITLGIPLSPTLHLHLQQ